MTDNPFHHPLAIRAHNAIHDYRQRTGDRTISLSIKQGQFRVEKTVTGPRGKLTTTSQSGFMPIDKAEALLASMS